MLFEDLQKEVYAKIQADRLRNRIITILITISILFGICCSLFILVFL